MKYLCPRCGESALIRREYHRKADGAFKKVDICLTKGCGYKKDHTPGVPSLAAVKKAKELKQGQLEFNL